MFVTERALETLIKQQIARLQDPSLECAHLIYEELKKIVFQIQIPNLNRYEVLNAKIHEVRFSFLDPKIIDYG